jgi:ssDNA-binding Zn-finger/Zn-ribbon topoisomerase 1
MPEDAEQPPLEKRIECPKCGSHDVRRSKSDNFIAIVARAFGRWPFRCRSCRTRFYRHADPPPDFQE